MNISAYVLEIIGGFLETSTNDDLEYFLKIQKLHADILNFVFLIITSFMAHSIANGYTFLLFYLTCFMAFSYKQHSFYPDCTVLRCILPLYPSYNVTWSL
jgi:hypothetical protein